MTSFARHAVFESHDEVMEGSARVTAGTGAFTTAVTFPRTRAEPVGTTTPEEMLAASHATCYGIGLRSLIALRGGRARRVEVTATVAAEKGPRGIRIRSSHLSGVVEALEGIDDGQLREIAHETEELCTVSVALRGSVSIGHDVTAR